VVVVGAGIAGLTCARALASHGVPTTVLDKGKTPGGRASTRAFAFGTFDHGARHFDVRRPTFAAWVSELERDGIAAPIASAGGAPTYRGAPTMGALAHHLARGLDVRSRVEVTRVGLADGLLRLDAVRDEREPEAHTARVLVVTTPPEQARALLRGFAVTRAPELASAASEPCLALIVTFPRGPLAIKALPSAFARAERERGAEQETWVFHTTPELARELLERTPDEVAERLVPLAAAALGADEAPTFVLAHRWRYARTNRENETRALVDPEARVVVAGDYLGDGRMESAYESGLLAAESALALLRAS
jgi:predicted NAD/FAD-dependent oxidoreductase